MEDGYTYLSMSTREQTLTLKCPLCPEHGQHSFPLTVEYSDVMGMVITKSTNKPREPRIFTRFFVCPVTGKRFSGQISVEESVNQPVKDVLVGTALTQDEDS